MRILTIVGARPQFVKAAVVSRAINSISRDDGVSVEEIIVHTGQHYDHNMSEVFFREMNIPEPAVNLSVGSGSHAKVTGAIMLGVEEEIINKCPDIVLVYGDTNSTMAAALAAVKLHVPVAHVEAGLRSFNRAMPEEINRTVTDHISTLLFCPSENSMVRLEQEGITKGVYVAGDVMYDAVRFYSDRSMPPPIGGEFALCTIHRAENTDHLERLKSIIYGLGDIPLKVLLALHPRTKKVAETNGIKWPDNVVIAEPLPYFTMLGCLKACSFVITDSGGLQKEAYFFGKKCVTVRDETEWVELVEAGSNKIVGADAEKIKTAINWAMLGGGMPSKDIYGDGTAGLNIVSTIIDFLISDNV